MATINGRSSLHVHSSDTNLEYFYLPKGWRDTWDVAKASLGTTPARVAIIGDSFLQGTGSTNFQTKGAQNLIANAIKTAHGDGGDFWATTDSFAFTAAYTGTAPWVKGTPASSFFSHNYSRCAFNTPTTGVGTYWTFTTPYACTDMDILYYRYNNTAGSWKYSLDGTADVTITPATQGKINRITITGLSNTTHTIEFKDATAVFTLGLLGVVTYKTKGTNVYVARAAYSGMRIAQYFENALNDPNSEGDATHRVSSMYWRGTTGSNTDTDFPALPHLAIIGVGLNDCINSLNVDTYYSYLARLIRALRRGRQDCSILLVVHNYPDSENSDSNDPSNLGVNWPLYTRAMYNISDVFGCGLVNVFAKWGETSYANGFQGNSDFHPTDAGHQDISDLVMSALTA